MTRPHIRNTTCPNCGRHSIGDAEYCPDCGQENHALEMTVGHLVSELLEHTLHLDSKLFRTTAALVFRPGVLTREYLAGRRQRYVPPVRLYIFTSVFFFFLLAVLPSGGHGGAAREQNTMNLSLYTLNSTALAGLSDTQIDSAMAANGIEASPLNRYAARKLAVIAEGGKAEFTHLLMKNISYAMFLLMPLFALFVYLVFRRSAGYYMHGLIYSVHLHSFAFLLLTAEMLAGRFLPALTAAGAAALLWAVYFIVSLRRLFREPMVTTILKAALLGVLYLLLIFGCLLLVILASIVLF